MTDTAVQNRSTSTPAVATPAGPATRLERLERMCADLWHREPDAAPGTRSRLLRQLSEVERWVASMTLRLTVDPDGGRRIEQQLSRYERRLDELASAWSDGPEGALSPT